MVVRGDIWLVNVDPTIGSEIKKSRPCVVISPPEMHDHLRTVIVAPMATGSRAAPFVSLLPMPAKADLFCSTKSVQSTRRALSQDWES